MKKIIIMTLILFLTQCNFIAKSFGGTIKVNLEKGERLVNLTWKGDSLWILTEQNQNKQASQFIFREEANFGILEGKVIITEK